MFPVGAVDSQPEVDVESRSSFETKLDSGHGSDCCSSKSSSPVDCRPATACCEPLKFHYSGGTGSSDNAVSSRHDEHQYLDQIRYILARGTMKQDRTGTGTRSIFGMQSRYSLRRGIFPLLTTKKVFFRSVAEELLWFIHAKTNAKELSAKNVRIWDANASRQFLDGAGLHHYEEGDLGPIYGFQWRHFGAEYIDCHADYSGKGIDQLQNIIDTIRQNPDDRRMILCAWNPADLLKMALPPCHTLVQFYVADGELSCQLYQRSADMGLGVPFNIGSYALLTHMIAHITNLKTGEFVHSLGDAHVYTNHTDVLREQISREPLPFPTLEFTRKIENINDFRIEDFVIHDYKSHSALKMTMAV